jgi:hypothetical protein
MRAAGAGLSVIRSTFDQNGIGMNLGIDPRGKSHGFSRSSFNDLSMQANNIAISVNDAGFISFSNIIIQGSANAPAGQSQIGLLVHFCQGSTFTELQIGGGFSKAAAIVAGGKYSTFYACKVSNSISRGQVWNVASGLIGIHLSNTAPATIADVDDSTASGIVAGVQGPEVDVTKHGLVGDGVTDNTAALRALINSATNGTLFYFPKGVYKVSATIDFSRLSSFSLIGAVDSCGGSQAGSTIVGTFGGIVLKVDYGNGAGTFQIRNLNLRSANAAGAVCLYTKNSILSSLQNVQVSGNIGIELVNPFMFSMRSVQFNGSAYYGSNIGLLVSGGRGCIVEQCDFIGWREGLRAAGSGLMVYASRFEVNHIGMNLGVDPNGNSSPLMDSSFAGISMEANDHHIIVQDCANCSFAGIGTQGSSNAPSGMTIDGLVVHTCQDCTFSAIGMGGAYSYASIIVSNAASNLLFDDCSASNGLGGNTWAVDPHATNVTLFARY